MQRVMSGQGTVWLQCKPRGVRSDLEASRACRGKAVLESPGEGVEHDTLAGGLREMGGQVAQQDGGIGPDGRLLIYLYGHRHTQSDSLGKEGGVGGGGGGVKEGWTMGADAMTVVLA